MAQPMRFRGRIDRPQMDKARYYKHSRLGLPVENYTLGESPKNGPVKIIKSAGIIRSQP